MKPDNFSEQIRRKLESVEPVFREKDWTRMQQALGHSTPVFALGTKAALMAAASLVTVMVFGGVAYHHYRASESLRNQVQTLTQTVSALRRQTAVAPTKVAAPVPDTVYLTRNVVRYVAVPMNAASANPTVSTNLPSDQHFTETTSTLDQQTVETTPAAIRNATSASPTALSSTGSNQQLNPPLTNPTAAETPAGSPTFGSTEPSGSVGTQRSQPSEPLTSGGRTAKRADRTRATQTTHSQPTDGTANRNGEPTAQSGVSTPNRIQLSLLTSRPLVRDTSFYEEGMARNLRRMRRLLSTAAPSGTALARVPVDRSEPSWTARGGNIANLGWRQWGAGLFGEIRLSSHWRIGAGLVSMNVKGGSFLTEVDYDRRTKQNFRRNFAPGIDPRHDIINITPKNASLQVPIRVSYRFGLGSNWSLVPSAGVNLSLSNREEIGFAYLRGPGTIESVSIVRKLPQQMLHAGSAAIYLEKNWGNWALQLGPYASAPLSSTPSRLNTRTAGVAVRLYYQLDWKKSR